VLQGYVDNAILLRYLELAKVLLHTTTLRTMPTSNTHSVQESVVHDAKTNGFNSKVNFTSRYKKKDQLPHNELEEFFKLQFEDFDSCNPLQWWVGQKAQFSSLFCLAHNLLSIPSMFLFPSVTLSGTADANLL
jgi:hypothetical protein